MKLHLGFEDHSYVDRYAKTSPLAPSVKKKRQKTLTQSQEAYGQGKTTREVAEELEKKYGVVEKFVELEEDFLIAMVEDKMEEDLNELLAMSHPTRGIKGFSTKETDKIVDRFRRDLSAKKFDGLLPGVPTTASLRGVSHLHSHPYAKRAPRPSFIDTGMYSRSFTAWVEEEDE